jgi:hypothetical protein
MGEKMKEISREKRKVQKKRNGKPHYCHTCQRNIPPGTKVEVQVYYGDGGINTVMTCFPCLNYIDKYKVYDVYGNKGLPPGAVLEDMEIDATEEEIYWIKARYFGYGGEKW